ncbi:zinc ribbon domain-containing protein [Saccharospirillum sp.]|uniref:zinc ribbon domain-containing protein n=1 Tax=Saccharospirillum sp. TaxID=2033801 RepID=UPI0034A00675
MKTTFWVLTLLLAIAGFVIPLLWGAALITALIAIVSAPPGKRADGKAKTGGLLGGVWDSAVISSKMKKCPSCAELIKKEAKVCKHCQRDVSG